MDAPGGPTMEVVDPAQNALRFAQAGAASTPG